MDKFNKAKADTKHKASVFAETGPRNGFALIAYMNALTAEAEAFRDMVLDADSVDDFDQKELKFSWEI